MKVDLTTVIDEMMGCDITKSDIISVIIALINRQVQDYTCQVLNEQQALLLFIESYERET